jgi:hypothetical protein
MFLNLQGAPSSKDNESCSSQQCLIIMTSQVLRILVRAIAGSKLSVAPWAITVDFSVFIVNWGFTVDFSGFIVNWGFTVDFSGFIASWALMADFPVFIASWALMADFSGFNVLWSGSVNFDHLIAAVTLT